MGGDMEPRKPQRRGGRCDERRRRRKKLVEAPGVMPGVLASFLYRGLRPAHVHKGCPGTWETS